jgi:adenine-specific DNA methylase
VFAHKTTEGWEALLGGIMRAKWTITASWPIATEAPNRLRAKDSAALATSVHLVEAHRVLSLFAHEVLPLVSGIGLTKGSA